MIKIKNALVLGAFSKIGIAICNKLESLGFIVYKQGVKPREEAKYIQADLSDESKVVDFFSKCPKNINLFVSCLGGNRGFNNTRSFDANYNISQIDCNWIFKMNLLTNIFCVRELIKRKCKNIIFIGSDVVGNPRQNGEVEIYACAKAALHEFTIQLANEQKNISVNCLSPGGLDELKLNKISIHLENICANKNFTGNVIKIKDEV